MPSSVPLLHVDDIVVRYGKLAAVRAVSLEVRENEIVCIIGPNGAGKSTTLMAIAGALPLSAGKISFAGSTISASDPESIARLGLSLVPEGRRVFGRLSVEENLRVGAGLRGDRKSIRRDIDRIFDHFPRLRERRNWPAGQLSGGEQQMLALGRAVLTKPRLIAVDEPSLGLAPIIVDQVYAILLEFCRTEKMALLIVEQSADRVMQLADRVYVLRSGRVELSGPPDEVANSERFEQAYFGFTREPAHRMEPA